MALYVLKRLLLMVPTLFGITVIVFSLSRLAPGDPVQAQFGSAAGGMGGDASGTSTSLQEEQRLRAAVRARWGLDDPIHVQYAKWIRNFSRGDFGYSIRYKAPVGEKLWPAMWVTIQLNLIAFAIIYGVSIPLGVHAAVRRNKPEERAIGVTLFGLYSAPSFWVATLMLFYFCNPAHWTWGGEGVGLQSEHYQDLPYLAQLRDYAHHLVLPVMCLTYSGFAALSRYARAGMLDVIRKDYVRTARAKGLPEKVVILKHALRNALIPIVTLFANLLPHMIGGSIVVEYIFTINGMGMLAFDSVRSRDYDTIMAITTLTAVLTLVGMLLSDLLYTVVDPRITVDK